MSVPAIIQTAVESEMPLLTNVLSAHPQLPAIAFKASFYSLIAQDQARGGKVSECNTASIINCLATAAGLGLALQPQLGQFFILPFKKVATPVIGVKGYNTLGARDDYTIPGEVVREGDKFEWEYGTNAFVSHKPIGPRNETRRIISSWSMAEHLRRKAIVKVLEIEELVAIKERSPAFKFGGDTPYKDDQGIQLGLVAMYEKTPKRRLARNMPLNTFVIAHALESQFEGSGRPAWLLPNQATGTLDLIDSGTGAHISPEQATDAIDLKPAKFFAILNGQSKERVPFDSIDQWRAALMSRADRITTKNGIETLRRLNAECIAQAIDASEGGAAADVERHFDERKTKLP